MILAFLIYKSPQCFLQSFQSIGPSVQEKQRKIDFQDDGHGSHLGSRIRTILAIFDLQGYQVSNQLAFWFRRLIVLGFNDTSTLVGHFVTSPSEREKRDRRDSRREEQEKEEQE